MSNGEGTPVRRDDAVAPMRRDDAYLPGSGSYLPGNDPLPTHTVEFVRIDGAEGLVRYEPLGYMPQGAGRPGRKGRRRPSPIPGLLALLVGIVTVVLLIIGVDVALRGDYAASRGIAYCTIGTSLVGVIIAIVALIAGRGRVWAVIGIVVCVLANPYVLTAVLGWFSSMQP